MLVFRVPQGIGTPRPGPSCVHARQLPLLHHRHNSSRYVPLRAVKPRSPEIADRIREYWDDEEDIEAAVERLGINKVQQGQESSPLHSKVNKMYLTKTFADGFLGPLELRHIEGKGYGLVATRDIAKGTLLAVCEPLAWVSGPPGTPPKLDTLIQHMKASNFTDQQLNVLLSLCSLPDLDLAHEQQQQQRQQQPDRLLQAGQVLEQQHTASRVGPAVSSYSLSKSRQLKDMQKKIMQDLGQDWDDQNDLDTLDSGDLRSRSDPWSSSSSSTELQQRSGGQQQRRTPDVLELLECTKEASTPAGASAADSRVAAGGSSSSSGRYRSGRWADGDGGSRGAKQLGSKLRMNLERLTALVLRNGHSEMCQDLAVSSIREDMPSAVTGIWPLLTMMNHSCAPNTVAVMVGEAPEEQQQQQPQQQLLPGEVFRQRQQQLLRSTGSSSSSSKSGPANRWAKNQTAAARGQPNTSLANSNNRSNSSQAVSKATTAAASSSSSSSGGAGVGPVILVRSVADLSHGDEITLDYLAPGVEGSLIHPERRREALLLRWGFTCRCERCTSETQLGSVLRRFQLTANSLTARLGPQVAAAVAAADTEVLTAAAARLSRAVQEVEQQVNVPNIPTSVGAWTHASVYQAHALLAICRMALDPSAMRSLACVGTAMELAGCVGPGCLSQLLCAAVLLVASEEAWGEGDKRVEGAARGLLEVLQLRYGPLEAEVAQKLAYSAQHWAQQLLGARLGLVAPAAATAARARAAVALAIKKRATAASSSDLDQLRKDTAAAAAAGSSAGEEDEQMAAALELDAEDVIEVAEEVLGQFYDDQDAAGSSAGISAAAAADPSLLQQQQQQQYDEPFIKQVDAAAVSEDLELFADYAKAGMSPDQREQAILRYMQQQQQQQEDRATVHDLQEERLTASQQQKKQNGEQHPAAAAAAAAGSSAGGDYVMDVEAESAVDEMAADLPMFAYLQGNSEAAAAEDEEEELKAQHSLEPPADTVAAAAAGPNAAAATGTIGEGEGVRARQQQPRTGKWAAAAAAAAQATREIKHNPAAAAARPRSAAVGAPQQRRTAAPRNSECSGSSSGGGAVKRRSLQDLRATGSFFRSGTAGGAIEQQQQPSSSNQQSARQQQKGKQSQSKQRK